MRRFLVVTDRLTLRGGAERYLGELVELAAGRGVEWHVAYGHDDRTAAPLAARFASATRVRGLEVGVPDRREASTVAALCSLRERLAPEAVLAQNALSPAVLTALVDDLQAALVVHDHRLFCPAAGKTLPDGAPCEQRVGPDCAPCLHDPRSKELRIELVLARLELVRRIPRVVAASAALASWLATEGVDPAALVVAPPPVPRWARDAEPAPPAHEREGAVVLGRLAAHKGCFHLLHALARRPLPGPLTWAGDGPAREAFEAEAARLGVRARVTGWLDDDELARVVRSHRVALLPSWWAEPFGLAGLEASALGLPVVAPAVGGIPEWLEDGETGVLTAPGDGDALVAATVALLQDASLAERLGRQGRERTRALFTPARFLATWSAALPLE